MKTLLLVVLFLAFTIPSTLLVIDDGYLGFVRLAAREPWALQMLVDLVIACSVFVGWMWRDAPARGIRRWPYLVAIATVGSIGVLAYLIRRRLATPTAAA
ncbi:MAG: DUF2834 domain-containing protein [Myxococcales bacterium]|nr:DUF2834 domain-containing protein [Myxococcales bacterium]